jgi:hypothetical protein
MLDCITTRWTKKGLIVDITDRVCGMLVAGGICGRREWYSHDTIRKAGFGPGDYMGALIGHSLKIDLLRRHYAPDRVLRKGIRIR